MQFWALLDQHLWTQKSATRNSFQICFLNWLCLTFSVKKNDNLEKLDSVTNNRKNPANFACDVCGKKFTRPYNLKSHLRTHTNERPFICSICGKAFARQHDRKRHEDLHTGKKRYVCGGNADFG